MGLFKIKDLCQQSLNHALQEEIKRCINEIQSQLCRKIMKNDYIDAGFSRKIILSDEAHFHFSMALLIAKIV